jgi:Zn-dependent metalloprotease
MMKNISVILFIFVVVMPMTAKESGESIIRYSQNGTVRSVEFSKMKQDMTIPKSADAFFTDILKKGANDEFKPNTDVKLDRGHETFYQYYKGVRVEGAGYTFHYDEEGDMCYAHGNYERIDNLNTHPSINKEEAKDCFARYKVIPINEVRGFTAELLIIMREGERKESPKTPCLTYKIFLNSSHPNNNDYGYVDAMTGEVVHTESMGICATSTGTFEMMYQSSNKSAQTDNTGSGYRLYDNSRNAVIHTRDLANTAWYNYSSASEVTDNDNYWHKTELPSNKNMALDVHWGLQKIYDRLYNAHGKNSFDNNGKAINAYVRAYMQITDDYWTYDNAQCLSYGGSQLLLFGPGATVFKPLAALDIIAHEFGHGITSYQIGWTSDEQFLNEGLSDIWGAIMDYRYGDNNTSVWKIGEKVMKISNKDCLRDIEAPNSSSAYNTTASTYGTSDYNSSIDPYYKGGVFSHWFYLLVHGGQGINGLNKYYNVSPISMDVAENLIVKAVYQNYLRNTTTYEDVRVAFINAARAMYVSGLETAVCNAWYAVGVGDMDLTISGPAVTSSQSVYSVNNLPNGFSVTWSLTDSYYNQYCLEQNVPSTNKCKITRNSSHDMSNATLTATIKYNGIEVQKLYKYHLYAHSGFKGTYFNGQATKTISLPTPLYFYPNKTNASISSPNLIDATISVSGTLASMPRSLDTTNGVLLFSTPNVSGSNTSVIHATCSNGDGYNLTIVTTTNTNLLNIIVGDGQMDVSLVPVVDDKLQEIDLVTKLKTPSFDTAANDFQTWTLEVYTATTGEKVFSQTVEGSSFTIDTTGWKPSVYVVRAVIGDEVLNEKVVVN